MNLTVTSLLDWYTEHRRDLPWRKTDNPYCLWLSEIMLQQTQIKTVIPYYDRWLKHYPTLESAAQATVDELLKLWEGLGYYARVRNFHQALKIVVTEYNGKIPGNWSEFRALPGVGEYTAAAVLSIAFLKPYPVLDGNVKRLMARLLGIRRLTPRNMKRILSNLNQWIKKTDPGAFNQAMMELGGRICQPNQPQCHACPLRLDCTAFQHGRPETYPEPTVKKKRPHYRIVVGCIWQNGRFIIARRPEEKMLGGLWEFPGGKIEEGESETEALKREIREECDLKVTIGKRVGTIRHAYSHFSIEMTLFHCFPEKKINQRKVTLITPEEIEQYAFPGANHKLFNLLNRQNWSQDR